jgi:hypothetical protein
VEDTTTTKIYRRIRQMAKRTSTEVVEFDLLKNRLIALYKRMKKKNEYSKPFIFFKPELRLLLLELGEKVA